MTLSDLGRRVFLVERQARPGGQARDVQASPHPPEEPSAALEQMARAVLERQDVELVAPATLEAVEGRAGRFTVGIRPWDGPVIEAKVGAIIVATGSAYPAPGMEGPLAGYASFEALLHSTPPGGLPTRVGFIADPAEVGEMLAQHAILDACLLRERAGSEAFVFLRDVPVRGRQGQSLYERALEAGVRFFRTDGRGTTVRVVEGAAVVAGHDQILDRPFELRCDLVVHGGPPETSLGTLEAARVLAMSIEERFLAPANVTFLPARTPREAVFAAGACAGDMGVEEAMRSGRMAALEAHDLLDRTLAGRTPDDVTIDRGRCVACLTCLRLCPYHAVTLGEASHYPSISDADCHDCGLCAAACPQRAITHHGLPDEAVVEQARGTALVALCCERSARVAADAAVEMGLALPAGLRIVTIPCAGIVSTNLILELLLVGVERVAVMGCCDDNCQNRRGSTAAGRRVAMCRSILEALGDDPARVTYDGVASNMPHLFVQRISGRDDPSPVEGGAR
jgi:coenzyme F420-reducing hydrogenase delta subunit/Pyruvate/2-oxoacid:ferredoxin oxidoreductase delta subunit